MSTFRRDDALARMAATTYDVVVIGAGMTGAGVAVDAASRGLRVALLDAGDLASGTSSKSSKMVHGGLRYLQQKEFALVRENLRERQRLLQNAPFLVRPLPFLIPLFGRDGVVAKTLARGYAVALRLYDLSGGWRIGHRFRRIRRDEALAHLPTLDTDRLVAGFVYYDARADDARVALTLARTAALDFDADVANYSRAVGVTRGNDGRVIGVVVEDSLTGRTMTVATRSVVNATGVWTDEVVGLHRGDRVARRHAGQGRARHRAREPSPGRHRRSPERAGRPALGLRRALRRSALHASSARPTRPTTVPWTTPRAPPRTLTTFFAR